MEAMMKSIFFNDTDEIFCRSNILISLSNVLDKDEIIGVRAVFLSSKTSEFTDKKLRKIASKQEYLNYKDDIKLAEKWDNVGLMLGDNKSNVNKVLVCLDVTTKVVKEAMTILGGLEEEAIKNYLIKYYAQRKATKKVRKKLEKELKNAKSI